MNFLSQFPLATVFGWLASFFCTLILFPQIIKAMKTARTRDISMSMLILSVVGNGFWVLHAGLTGNTPLIVGAALIGLMSVLLIIFKFMFDKNG